ncbi:HemY domain protein [Beijerinckiaceae bacterium RH AL1]|nr:HemY domain protein [Beijerinckiaceae bacterium RH CH11]VVB47744.1 HemY domain protein [Beijerinckiaceae bacterium RH AL8]VVC56002.1 HemY domain protein [Beijerinckiaceae bacterium RH AL1]
MIRVVLYLLVLAGLAWCGVWLIHHPGHVELDWFGAVVSTSAALLVLGIAIAAILVWTIVRFVLGFPSFVAVFARQRRREKGYAALSRGLIAAAAGDARTAGRAATQARKNLKNDPLALMLRAQAAHMNDDGPEARAAFEALAQRDDTRVLGLRGLHAEATRRGDEEAARHFAAAAHQAAPLPWSAQAVLEHRASAGDWEQALATVETSIAARLVDKATGERQRAVLETAIAYDKELSDPEAALKLARSAMRRAPDLAPAVVVAANLLSRRGEIGKASKLIEKAWPRCQHPDIARAYLDVRPGDSTADRLARARTLMGIASFDPVSRMVVARAALATRDFAEARRAMAPLIAEGKRPSVRACLIMAELEEAEHGDLGQWREWLARASRAPLDPAWVADGVVYDHWAPASPTTGKLDAFQWQVPAEREGMAMDAMPPPPRPAPPEAIDATPLDALPPAEPRALAEGGRGAGGAPTSPAAAAPASEPVQPRRPLFYRDKADVVDERHKPIPPAANGATEPAAAPGSGIVVSGPSESGGQKSDASDGGPIGSLAKPVGPEPENAGDAHPPVR